MELNVNAWIAKSSIYFWQNYSVLLYIYYTYYTIYSTQYTVYTVRTGVHYTLYSIQYALYRISYRVTGSYRLGKTCYLHSLLCNNSIIAQFSVQ